MRIVAGRFGSRKLFAPKDYNRIRPTSDRTRETIFNVLSNVIDITGKKVIDLFAGTGALGIEALSRGAKQCTFVDIDLNVIRKNIEAIDLDEITSCVKKDVAEFLKSDEYMRSKAGIVFADPPYKFDDYDLLVTLVSQNPCIFVLEHEKEIMPMGTLSGKVIKTKKSGRAFITIFDFRIRND